LDSTRAPRRPLTGLSRLLLDSEVFPAVLTLEAPFDSKLLLAANRDASDIISSDCKGKGNRLDSVEVDVDVDDASEESKIDPPNRLLQAPVMVADIPLRPFLDDWLLFLVLPVNLPRSNNLIDLLSDLSCSAL